MSNGKPFGLRGTTNEERIASAETAIRQIIRQVVPKRIVVQSTNVGVGGYIPELGEIKMLVPVTGRLTFLTAYCGSIPLTPGASMRQTMLHVDIELPSQTGLFESSMNMVGEGRSSTQPDKDVTRGMRLLIHSDAPIIDFWYSFEIAPTRISVGIDNPQLDNPPVTG